jgi:hypothetical protein
MDVYGQLRKKFDGADSFVAGGHIVRGGGETRHAERLSRTPEWVNDDAQVRSLLLRVFPNLKNNEAQRKSAAKWLSILNLYYRMGKTDNEVAQETGLTEGNVRVIICRINRAAAGKTANGKTKSLKRGRPRKDHGYPNI